MRHVSAGRVIVDGACITAIDHRLAAGQQVELAAQRRAHTMERSYVCVSHGVVTSRRIESFLVADRGDRLLGSTSRTDRGKRAVTHVEAREALRGATLCDVRLETGKTHQI